MSSGRSWTSLASNRQLENCDAPESTLYKTHHPYAGLAEGAAGSLLAVPSHETPHSPILKVRRIEPDLTDKVNQSPLS
jgi:hypothetical protein